jgi:hypothetical protein
MPLALASALLLPACPSAREKPEAQPLPETEASGIASASARATARASTGVMPPVPPPPDRPSLPLGSGWGALVAPPDVLDATYRELADLARSIPSRRDGEAVACRVEWGAYLDRLEGARVRLKAWKATLAPKDGDAGAREAQLAAHAEWLAAWLDGISAAVAKAGGEIDGMYLDSWWGEARRKQPGWKPCWLPICE